MKVFGKQIVGGLGVTILILLLLFLLLIRSQDKLHIVSLNQKNELLNSYITAKVETEGKLIWDIGIFSETTFNDSIIKLFKKEPILFFLYDTVGCSNCYNYHVHKINTTNRLKNTIILHNGGHNFLKKDFPQKHFIKYVNKEFKYKEVLLFVNYDGHVLYVDFPQFSLIDFSEKFYNVILRY